MQIAPLLQIKNVHATKPQSSVISLCKMPKPDIVVNTSQLRNAFKAHQKVYQNDKDNPSCQLLLFYAVETGLKSLFLEKRKYRTTLDFQKAFGENKKYGHGHKILKWISELKIAASHIAVFSDDESDPIENVHEKLRYGSTLSGNIGKNQIAYLRSIATYLSKNI